MQNGQDRKDSGKLLDRVRTSEGTLFENAVQEVRLMATNRTRVQRAFFQGLAMAITAHLAAAFLFLSGEGFGRFLGHVVGAFAIRFLGNWPE